MKNKNAMKRLLLIGGLVAAFLCLAQNAGAQYVQIHRDGAGFVDNQGMFLSDQALIDLVGEDVYFDTVVGARKQFDAGRKLIRSGAICAGAGMTGILVGTVALATSGMGYDYNSQTYYDMDGQAALGGLLMFSGCLAAVTGGLLLDAGIPLKIIGKSRLNWVENDFNERSRGYSLHVGAAPGGMGLTLQF